MNPSNLKWLGFHYSVIKDNYRLAKFSNLLLTKYGNGQKEMHNGSILLKIRFYNVSYCMNFFSLSLYLWKRSSFLSWLIYRETSSFLFSHRSNILFLIFVFITAQIILIVTSFSRLSSSYSDTLGSRWTTNYRKIHSFQILQSFLGGNEIYIYHKDISPIKTLIGCYT